MKTLTDLLNESMITEASYERLNNYALEYRNQMDFQKYFKARAKAEGYKGLLKDKWGLPHSFDYIYCYDTSTSQNIDGVVCDGTLTFNDAYTVLISYYQENRPELME